MGRSHHICIVPGEDFPMPRQIKSWLCNLTFQLRFVSFSWDLFWLWHNTCCTVPVYLLTKPHFHAPIRHQFCASKYVQLCEGLAGYVLKLSRHRFWCACMFEELFGFCFNETRLRTNCTGHVFLRMGRARTNKTKETRNNENNETQRTQHAQRTQFIQSYCAIHWLVASFTATTNFLQFTINNEGFPHKRYLFFTLSLHHLAWNEGFTHKTALLHYLVDNAAHNHTPPGLFLIWKRKVEGAEIISQRRILSRTKVWQNMVDNVLLQLGASCYVKPVADLPVFATLRCCFTRNLNLFGMHILRLRSQNQDPTP